MENPLHLDLFSNWIECQRKMFKEPIHPKNVLVQREMEKRRSPLVHRFRPGGRGFSRHDGVYRPMTLSGQCPAREGKLPRC